MIGLVEVGRGTGGGSPMWLQVRRVGRRLAVSWGLDHEEPLLYIRALWLQAHPG